MMKKIKTLLYKRIRYLIMAMILLFSIMMFAFISFLYVQRFNDTLLEDNQAHLAEVADHIVVYTKTVLSDTKHSLQNTANVLMAIPEEQWMIYLEDIVERENLTYIGYAKRDGEFHSSESFLDTNIKEEKAFQQALASVTTMSDMEQKILYDRVISGVVITVPIYDKNQQAVGALSAMLDLSKIDSALKVESFQGDGYSYIIDAQGNLILQNKSINYSNFYKILEAVDIESGESADSIQQKIKSNQSGLVLYRHFGEERYMYHTPIGINDWTIINVVPKYIITEKTDVLIQQLTVMNTTAIILFFLLFCTAGGFWIMSQNQKNKAEAKSAFLANMSHEIRTPMNAIVGTSEILRRSNLTKNQEYYVGNIINSSQGLLTIVNDILDYSKMESGKFQLLEEEYDIESLLFDVTTLATVRLGEKDVSFQMLVDESVPVSLVGDMPRIKQVLVNIVGNAVKFTEHGYIRVHVSVIEKDKKTYLKMDVIDTGSGIRKQDLSKLFISFNQVDTHHNHNKEGTGLGLAISMGLCKMMEGNIQVESEYGKGSTFTLTMEQKRLKQDKLLQTCPTSNIRLLILEESKEMREFYKENLKRLHIKHYTLCATEESFWRLLEQEEYEYVFAKPSIIQHSKCIAMGKKAQRIILLNQREPESVGKHLTIYSPLFGVQLSKLLNDHLNKEENCIQTNQNEEIDPLPNIRILVVDDNDLNREIACDILAFFQIETEGAASGKIALSLLQNNDYDLVFMDHMMPEMDGVETMQAIRSLEDPKYQKLPIIALTANATKEAQKMFIKMGFDDFMAKPMDIKKLSLILEHWLRNISDERSKTIE